MVSKQEVLNLMLIGAGPCQIPAIEQAHKLGVKVFAIDGNPEAPGLKMADWSEVGNIKDYKWVREIAAKKNKEIGIDGVMTLGVEVCKGVGAVIDELGLIGVNYHTADLMTDKSSRYFNLDIDNVKTARHRMIRQVMEWWWFPCVVKPCMGSAAENVRYVESDEELQKIIKPEMYDNYLIEEYLDGHELNTETIVLNSSFHMTFIGDRNYDKKFKYKPWMIEDGGELPSKIDLRIRNKVCHIIGKIIKAFDIEKCILKCDLIVKDNIVYVLECVPRLSGGRFCSHQIPLSTGVEMVNIAVRMALGLPVYPQELIPKKNEFTAQRYIFPDGDIKSHRDRGKDFICTGKTMAEAISNAQNAVKTAQNPTK